MVVLNKRQGNPKGQSRIENPDTVVTLDTQDTGRRQTKHTHTHKANTEHYRYEFEDTLLKQGVNTFAPEE